MLLINYVASLIDESLKSAMPNKGYRIVHAAGTQIVTERWQLTERPWIWLSNNVLVTFYAVTVTYDDKEQEMSRAFRLFLFSHHFTMKQIVNCKLKHTYRIPYHLSAQLNNSEISAFVNHEVDFYSRTHPTARLDRGIEHMQAPTSTFLQMDTLQQICYKFTCVTYLSGFGAKMNVYTLYFEYKRAGSQSLCTLYVNVQMRCNCITTHALLNMIRSRAIYTDESITVGVIIYMGLEDWLWLLFHDVTQEADETHSLQQQTHSLTETPPGVKQ